MINAAVVGLGWWGKQIVTGLRGSDRVRVTRGVDVDPQAAGDFADEMGLALTGRFEDALKDPDLDAVFIVTPHSLHEEQVLAAAAAGKHIFCEKPLALSGGAARRMLDACDEKGLVLGIGHERRFEGPWEEMLRMATSGELGLLLHMEMNASYNLMAGTAPSGWRQNSKEAPAGTMTALGVHQTDFMLSVCGPVRELYAVERDRSPGFPGNDILTVQFNFENGMTGTLASLANTPFYQRCTLLGDQCWVESRETANVDKPDPGTLTWRGLDLEIHHRTYKRTDTVSANILHWIDAVEGKAEYRFTKEQRLQNVLILEAIVESSRSGKPVAIG